MWFKIIIILISVISLSLAQVSFISALPFPFYEFDLLIIFLVFFRALFPGLKNIWIFALAGLIFDVFYIPVIDIFVVVWPLIFLICDFLSSNVFTNRSLYSFLATGFFVTIFYSLILNSAFYLFRVLSSEAGVFILDKGFWLALGSKIILNLLVIIICFYIINFLSNRLRPVFIIKRRYEE